MSRRVAIVLTTALFVAVVVLVLPKRSSNERGASTSSSSVSESASSSASTTSEVASGVTSEQWQQMLRRLDALEQQAGRASSDRLPVNRDTMDADALREIRSRIERLEAEIDELRSHVANAHARPQAPVSRT
jgi:uncharacterized protein (UPF0335 family)